MFHGAENTGRDSAMEMSQIRYALAAAKALNFTKAAADCNVSQPALTKAIKTLEADLGAPLFHREGRRVLLSEFGQTILPHLQHILDETQVARTLADNFRLLNQVPVRIGIMSTVGHLRLSRFLAKFQQEYEGVEVAVTEASVADAEKRPRRGRNRHRYHGCLGRSW
jgi:DNA-binding transcriptional LysR family regulator